MTAGSLKSERPNQAIDPIELFQRLLDGEREVRLVNIYKGVPISYPATLLKCGDSGIRVRTERFQMACLYREKETFIQSTSFLETIYARVIELDLPRVEAVLGNLTIIPNAIGDRTQVRVQPSEAIRGHVHLNEMRQAIPGELADISRNGVGIYLRKGSLGREYLLPGKGITVSLHLPGEYEMNPAETGPTLGGADDALERFSRSQLRVSHVPGASRGSSAGREGYGGQKIRNPRIAVDGVIAYVLDPPGGDRVRVGVRMNPANPSRPLIALFITQRQSEIIRELRTLVDMLTQKTSE